MSSASRARCLRVSSVVHTAQPISRTFTVDVRGTLKPRPSASHLLIATILVRNGRFIYLIHQICVIVAIVHNHRSTFPTVILRGRRR